jgi:AraC-like DNA-binding protein
MFASAGGKCPQIQLGAENNIEKSRCLAQMRKKIFGEVAADAGFSGLRAFPRLIRRRAVASFTVISVM